jgi:twitching motility protein PilT
VAVVSAAGSGNVLIDKLLTTVMQLKASDLHITVGQPPVVRHQGRMRRLDTKTLDSDDTTGLMKSITPDRCQQELQEKGGSDFAIEYTDGVRFRVAIFKQRGSIGMVLRRIPSKFLSFEEIGMPASSRARAACCSSPGRPVPARRPAWPA